MLWMLSILFAMPVADAGPLVTHGINSSRVEPGTKVKGGEVIEKMSKVDTINVGTISGPHAKTFTTAAISSLNDTRQGKYKTGADSMAGVVGGMGKLASVGTKTVVSSAGFVGSGMVGKAGAKAMDKASDAAAARLDGIDRHPEEGFGMRSPEVAAAIASGAMDEAGKAAFEPAGGQSDDEPEPGSALDAKLGTAATVAGAVGLGQVQSALELGKDMKGVFQAFSRSGVKGNSPKFLGVNLPIEALKEGRGDAQITATIKRTQDPDKHFKEKRKKKKRDKNGKVVKDKDGKVIWITYEVDCVKRVVHVDVRSKLSLRSGGDIMSATKKGSNSDKKCGKDRMKEIASPEKLARPIVRTAGSQWGRFVQPQMDTVRLKLYPTGTSALGVMYMMRNSHTASMCLLDDAIARDANDPGAHYNKAILLEAYGLYDKAMASFQTAYQSPELAKPRFKGGSGRVLGRQNSLKTLEAAYGMVAEETSFPYAETCPAIDISGTQPTTQRVKFMDGPGGEMIRRLYEGERLRVIGAEKKWLHVQQIDGSEGWVKAKVAFKVKK